MNKVNTDHITTLLGFAKAFVIYGVSRQFIDTEFSILLTVALELFMGWYTNKR
jgi:hypothetical protein